MASRRNRITHTQPSKLSCFALIASMSIALSACGERYTEQAHALVDAMTKDVVKKGLCDDFSSCYSSMELNAAHSTQIGFYIYAAKDRVILAAMLDFIAAYGIGVTGGIPISIHIYREKQENVHFWTTPMIELKVRK